MQKNQINNTEKRDHILKHIPMHTELMYMIMAEMYVNPNEWWIKTFAKDLRIKAMPSQKLYN